MPSEWTKKNWKILMFSSKLQAYSVLELKSNIVNHFMNGKPFHVIMENVFRKKFKLHSNIYFKNSVWIYFLSYSNKVFSNWKSLFSASPIFVASEWSTFCGILRISKSTKMLFSLKSILKIKLSYKVICIFGEYNYFILYSIAGKVIISKLISTLTFPVLKITTL